MAENRASLSTVVYGTPVAVGRVTCAVRYNHVLAAAVTRQFVTHTYAQIPLVASRHDTCRACRVMTWCIVAWRAVRVARIVKSMSR